MSNLFWLTDEQMARLQPYFPKSHGRQRVDDRRVLSGIIFVNRNGLRWCDAPKEYGPAKTLYNRWKRWGDKGIFLQMMEGLAVPEAAEHKTIMIDATYLKAALTVGLHERRPIRWIARHTSVETSSSDCSASSKTGGASQPVTTA